jgi:hypothetical protein
MSGAPLTINVKQASSGGCSATTFTGVSPNQSATIVTPDGTVTSSGVGSYKVTGLSGGQPVTVNISDASGHNKCVEVEASSGGAFAQAYAPFLNVANSTYQPTLLEQARAGGYMYGVTIPSNYTEPAIMSYQVASCTLAQYLKANNVCDASTTAVQTEPIETNQLSVVKNGSSELFSSTNPPQGFVPGELHSLSVKLYPALDSTPTSLSAPSLYTNTNLGLVYDIASTPTQEATYASLSNGSATDTMLAAPDLSINVGLQGADVTRAMSLQPPLNEAILQDTLYGPIQAKNDGSCPTALDAYSSAPTQNPQMMQGTNALADNTALLHFHNTQKDIFTTAVTPLGSKYGCYAWQASVTPPTGQTADFAAMLFKPEVFDYAAPAVVTPPPPPPALPTPSVTSLTPEYGPVAGGTTVTITGSNLNGASAVDFGSDPSTIVSDTSSQIVVTDPAHTAGPVSVTVHAAYGDVIAGNFTYIPPAPIKPVIPPAKRVVAPPTRKAVTHPANQVVTPPVVQKAPAPVKTITPASISHPVKHGISIVTGTGNPVRRDSVPPVVPVALVGTGLLLAGIARRTQKAAR